LLEARDSLRPPSGIRSSGLEIDRKRSEPAALGGRLMAGETMVRSQRNAETIDTEIFGVLWPFVVCRIDEANLVVTPERREFELIES
jgi:hypothetical protein